MQHPTVDSTSRAESGERAKTADACLVMDAAHAPHDAHIAVGVPAIQLPLVIQVYAKFDGLLRAIGPTQGSAQAQDQSVGALCETAFQL